MIGNVCGNRILVSKSNKYNCFKRVTVLQILLEKGLNKNLSNSVDRYTLLCKRNNREGLYKGIYIQITKALILPSLGFLKRNFNSKATMGQAVAHASAE